MASLVFVSPDSIVSFVKMKLITANQIHVVELDAV